MSYISAITKNNNVLVWERSHPGYKGRKIVMYDAEFYCYVYDADNPTHYSLYKDPLRKITFETRRDMLAFTLRAKNEKRQLFESDIPTELKTLSEHYYNVPAPTLNITFLDIEVDYSKEIGYSSVSNPYAPINAVAFYHTWSNRMVIAAVLPDADKYKGNPNNIIPTSENLERLMDNVEKLPDTNNDIYICKNETELLHMLLHEIENSDVLSGWNSSFFDIPYIGKRLMNMDDVSDEELANGKVSKHFNKLSFDKARRPSWREIERYGQTHQMLDLGGRISLDYLDLFRKYEPAERPSYKLESIADEVLPNMKKLEYEGSLASLYTTNFPLFCRYNFRDTEILKGFEDTLGYVELANQIVHLSTGLFKHVGGTIKLAELATINYCHHELDNIIVNDVQTGDGDEKIKGALVLIPQVGMHENIGSVDLNSLYPSVIRSLNISPETLIGQFSNKEKDAIELAKGSNETLILLTEDSEVIQMSAKQWRTTLKSEKWAVSGFGTVFDQNEQGVIPAILENWYATRKEYQQKMSKAKDIKNDKQSEYFNRLQYVYKIKLNSFYGALNNAYFRFFDLRMGESTTATSRHILLHQCAQTNKELMGEYALPDRICIKHKKGPNKGKYEPATQEQIDDPEIDIHYGYTDKYPMIYSDTDSCYFSIGSTTDGETYIEKADKIGILVNETFTNFMKQTFLCNQGFDDIIKTGREIVSDRGIFVDKKRYMLHIINDDGYDVDKCKVMGVDTKKTTIPKEVAQTLNKFVERLLKGDNWDDISEDVVRYKAELEDITPLNFMGTGLPKGVKNIEKYTKTLMEESDCFLPGHVAAAIHFNQCIIDHDDKETIPIHSGDKIKIFYTIQQFGRFKAIAIPVDIEQIPQWFIDDFVPLIDIEAHIERLINKPLNNIIKAIGLTTPSKQSLFVESIIEF
jgi:DNA polymerase elongation subunit (family B)